MVVLSLFDGISCGSVALEKARQENPSISVDKYFASEIDEVAIQIATKNNPDIIEIGDVRQVSYDREKGILHTANGDFEVKQIDLLIGGSPCTDFSSIGLAKGMVIEERPITTLETYLEYKTKGYSFSGYSYLFWEYVRILHEVKPKHFLLENVLMASRWREIITNTLGCVPKEINSALVSGQWRRRLYWTDIPCEDLPADKHIMLDDIFDKQADLSDYSHSLIVQKSFPRLLQKYKYIPNRFNAYNATEIVNKSCTLTTGSRVSSSSATLIWVKVPDGLHSVENGIMDNQYPVNLEDGKYNLRRLSILEMERLQTLPDNYTALEGLSDSVRGKCIGNGWTVDVIKFILEHIVFDRISQ